MKCVQITLKTQDKRYLNKLFKKYILKGIEYYLSFTTD